MLLGERLRLMRVRNHWTQEDLSKRLNVAVSTISGYENNTRRPDIETLILLGELFDISIDYLVGRERMPGSSSIELADDQVFDEYMFKLDGQPLSEEDRDFLLAIIREKRNIYWKEQG